MDCGGLPLIQAYRKNTSLLAVVLLVAACASKQPEPPGLPYGTFSSISLISQTDLIDIVTPETKTDRAKEGFGKGATTGGVSGMAAGAVCGPYWGLCAGGFGLIGWLGGGVAGAMYGFSGVSAEDSAALEQKLHDLQLNRDFQSILVAEVKRQLPDGMLAPPESAEIQAILVLESMEFVNRDQKIFLRTHARLTFTLDDSTSEPAIGSKVFKARSGASDLDKWLADDSSEMQAAVRECLDLISGRVAAALNQRWAP
ncbi:hypothetical protein [Haliea sp. E17]|uniref:hypothetical protein n=1 Tax=Haliea sp. E17 TaxID=3401576 RepID=UPI003AB05650